MSDVRIGYARCSTDKQDLQAQRDYLLSAGVAECDLHFDEGLTGRNTNRAALKAALAQAKGAAAAGATVTLVVPKLDRLGRSIRDLHDIADQITEDGVRLEFAGQLYDPADAMSKMFFNMLGVFAEFEVDLLSQRTKEGMAVAKAKGRLQGGKPKLGPAQQAHLRRLHAEGYSISQLQEEYRIGRATVYRILKQADAAQS